jgi:choline dehydrogenase-like flavoprotein
MSGTEFDYVIVGGGTAGCALACRMAEDPGARVCLIEAGGDERHWLIRTPALVGAAIAHKPFNWGFTTTPQSRLDGRRIPVPRGRVLGGSGSINGMVYSRGHPRDYDDWAAAGATGWSYAEVLPYFTRSERNEDYPASIYHGQGGPMNVSRPPRPNRLNRDFIDATVALGYVRSADFNGPDSEGVGLRQGSIRRGKRESTASAYLRPAMRHGRVAVLSDTLAHRVIIKEGRAVGVLCDRNGSQRVVRATREVVLTAGAYQSPQLLMLSGIGDGALLKAHGIEPVNELPGVGRNLHDHLACPVVMRTRDSTAYGISWRTLPRSAWNVIEYLAASAGPLGSNVFESVAFLRTNPALDRPDVQFVFQPAGRPTPTCPLPVGHGYAISPVGLYPKSRGRITLAGPDPHQAPLIDPALLSAAGDIEPLMRGIKLARRILGAPNFARYHAVEAAPGSAMQSDEAIDAFIRATAYTVHHPVGTCRMGRDADSVVDAELRVRGITGLRVADASVMPSIIGGNTNAAVIMIAEKAADLMKGRPPPPAAVEPAAPSFSRMR